MRTDRQTISLPDVVGRGYGTFWNFTGRYRVCKGSRASKKSKTTALNLITRMMAYPHANLLVVRKVYRTLKDSCFAELKWAVHRLGADAFWEVKEHPLEMTYTPTGQKIYFRGLDDPLKVTSITVDVGQLCFLWLEEAYEVTSEENFDMLDESIRGKSEPGLFKQITVTFNPCFCASPARGKKEGQPRFPFLFGLQPFLCCDCGGRNGCAVPPSTFSAPKKNGCRFPWVQKQGTLRQIAPMQVQARVNAAESANRSRSEGKCGRLHRCKSKQG